MTIYKNLLFAGLLSVGTNSLYSQQLQNENEDIYELSPFSISESEEIGYQATSTLAGTRIRTPLKDLGSAISVVTAEFLEDTGATDAGTLLSYTSNTEVGGMNGNFAGGASYK